MTFLNDREDSIYFELDPIIVTADRFELNLIKSSFSIDKIENQNYEKNLSINDLINSSAGVFNQNANNFAQDLRVSIRGFGARSSFGIRGIKIIVDPKCLMYLDGTELDFAKEGLNEGFKFTNPNEKARCGCGESFSL